MEAREQTLLSTVAAAALGGTGAAPAPPAAPVPMTAERFRAEHPAIAAALVAEGATAERARIEGIRSAMFAGQDDLAAQMIADGKTSPGEAALRFNAEHKKKGPDHLAAIAAADKHVQVPANGGQMGGTAVGDELQGEDAWRAEWKGSPALQREFVRVEDYVALMKSEGGRSVRSIARPAR